MSGAVAALPDEDVAPDLHSATERYAARFAGPVGAWMLEVQAGAVLGFASRWPGGTVLDVGGGHAQVAGPLAEAGHRVTVHASAEPGLARVRAMAPAVATVTGPLDALPLPDRSVDIVCALRMMAHVPDWEAFVAECCRVARHGVIIDFAVAGGANALQPIMFAVKKRIEGNTRRFTTQSKSALEKAFRTSGFGVSGMTGQFVMPMVVHRKLNRPGLSQKLEGGCAALGLDRWLGTPVILCATRESA